MTSTPEKELEEAIKQTRFLKNLWFFATCLQVGWVIGILLDVVESDTRLFDEFLIAGLLYTCGYLSAKIEKMQIVALDVVRQLKTRDL